MKISKLKGTIQNPEIVRKAALFPLQFKIKGLEKLEVDRMNETEFEEAAMKVALEMSERQALMRCYQIPPDIIYESMRSQREVFLKDGYSLVLKEKAIKG